MEYTSDEKQILSLMERTDFRNLSKNDVLSYASKLNELRPEVAQQVIAQFPELAKLIQSTMVEYKDILDRQMEIFHAVDKKDTEIREHEMEMARMADKKDTEKKEFNWKVLGAASFVVLTAVGIGTAALGGKFDFKLPKKS